MPRYLLVGLAGGIIFILLDAVLNANPLAQRLSAAYRPIARSQIKMIPALLIDILYGFAMAGLFLVLRNSFPGGWVGAAVSFGVLAWFFRVLMSSLSQWVMFEVPVATHLYAIAAGLLEMLALGFFYAIAFKSFP